MPITTGNSTTNQKLSIILFILITAGMVAWQLSGTDWVDDWNYKLMPESHDGFWHMKGEKITDFNQAAEAIGRHHCYTTPRLPNYLQTFANLLPAWPVRTLHGLMLAATFLILALSCGGRRIMQSAGFVAVLWLAAWVILPINNLMISSDFAFNYFWTSPLIMIFVYLLTSGKLRSGRWSFIPWATAAIVGTMHEGATFPVAAGCVALIAVNKTDRLRRAALLSVMAGVAIAFFFNSGMMERIGQHVTERDNTFLKYMTINLFIESYGLYLAIASVVIASIKGGAPRDTVLCHRQYRVADICCRSDGDSSIDDVERESLMVCRSVRTDIVFQSHISIFKMVASSTRWHSDNSRSRITHHYHRIGNHTAQIIGRK